MASRSRQHRQIDCGTAHGRINAAAACRAGRRSRQALARVAGGAQACSPRCPGRTDRSEPLPDRHQSPPASAGRATRCYCDTLAEHDRRRNPDLVGASTAAPRRAGNQNGDRQHRSVCRGETRHAIDQAAPQGAPVQRDTRPQRRRSVCRTPRAGRCQPVLFHAAGPPQLSRAGYHTSHPRRGATAAHTRAESRGSPRTRAAWGERQTLRWRGMDSNPRSPGHGELCCRAPYRSLLRRAGGGEVGTAVQPDFFCSACHSIEPGVYTIWVGCGLSRCSAASAFRR
jgi:hypothetical protein